MRLIDFIARLKKELAITSGIIENFHLNIRTKYHFAYTKQCSSSFLWWQFTISISFLFDSLYRLEKNIKESHYAVPHLSSRIAISIIHFVELSINLIGKSMFPHRNGKQYFLSDWLTIFLLFNGYRLKIILTSKFNLSSNRKLIE